MAGAQLAGWTASLHGRRRTASSNIATVTLTIGAVNDAPVANNNSYAKNEDTTLTVSAGRARRHTDVDNSADRHPGGGGTTRGAFALNANGSFTCPQAVITMVTASLRPNDGLWTERRDGDLTVVAVSDPPVASPTATARARTHASCCPGCSRRHRRRQPDADGHQGDQPGHGTVTLNGSFTCAERPARRTDSFTYKTNDGTTARSPPR
jgi:hypothetical protein